MVDSKKGCSRRGLCSGPMTVYILRLVKPLEFITKFDSFYDLGRNASLRYKELFGFSVNPLLCRHKPVRSMPHAVERSSISSTKPRIEGFKLNFLSSVELCFAFMHELVIGKCLVLGMCNNHHQSIEFAGSLLEALK